MNSDAARTTLIAVGVIALLIGLLFTGQGIGLIPGSSMSGDTKWFYIGLGLAIVGIVLLVVGLPRRRRGRD